jgi:hypothetical protein
LLPGFTLISSSSGLTFLEVEGAGLIVEGLLLIFKFVFDGEV